ncbi:IclR family transcriptional regulator [Bacillus gobiensis]|uniref:IclR family transcriptional regulator n=1 Tax=Bacillus gobiensis TaxID=1441095 RepID=UPI003D200ECA
MKGTQTLERALDILFILAKEGGTLSVSEIAQKVSIPESTAYRFLQTLERNGIIERKGKGLIGLGLRILDLAKNLNNQIEQQLRVVAKSDMEQLAEETGETVVLFVRTGLNVICIQNVPGSYLVRFVVENGKTFALNEGATGKAILAFENKKVIDQVLHSLKKEDALKLIKELESIRKKGYSSTSSEVDTGIFGIAAPIYDNMDRVIASVTVVGPSDRVKVEEVSFFVDKVMQAANNISEKLKLNSKVIKKDNNM